MKTERRKYLNSSSFVMALLFTVLCGLVALCLGYFINYFAKGHFIHSTEAVLESETRYVDLVGVSEVLEVGHTERLYAVLKRDGRLPDYIAANSISRLAEGILVFDVSETGKRYAAKIHTSADNRKVLIGVDITSISDDFRFMQWIGIASICFVMLVVFVSYLISLFVVNGTNKIADTARDIIETGDLSRRVDIGSRWDDLGNMAAVLNMLLDRVEELMHGVRHVSDSIAHDLRTPLTRMRNHIEGLQKQYGHADYAELMGEADHLLTTFNALLRISRIEAGKQRQQFIELNLKDILDDVIAFYEPLAEEKSIELRSDLVSCAFYGDRDLLFQAYANILDNALKYTPDGGQVFVRLFESSERFCIEISDNGPGVPENDLDKIFDRFYRVDKSRSSSGTGLGLSLVSAVIALHAGEVVVENNQPGLRIITIL